MKLKLLIMSLRRSLKSFEWMLISFDLSEAKGKVGKKEAGFKRNPKKFLKFKQRR